jgi:uncharacterized protein RhaS with RHS repeats
VFQRYYNPWFGRFNTPDPTVKNVDLEEPGSWNHYSYVGGDPVNFGDPTGLWKSVCEEQPFNPICSDPGLGPINGYDPGIFHPINDEPDRGRGGDEVARKPKPPIARSNTGGVDEPRRTVA